jgi:AbrB family looped-hinge helix DNA binding protein
MTSVVRTFLFFGGASMEQVGIVAEVDKLGRIVIPKKVRDLYGLDKGVELVLTDKGVYLRSPHYVLIKRQEEA